MYSEYSIISHKCEKDLTYLLVRFVQNAQRAQKSRYFIHRKTSYAFRWSISCLSVPSPIKVQGLVVQCSTTTSTQQSLLDCRKYSRSEVSEYAWRWSYRNDRSSQTQRSVSISCWSSCISESNNSTTIPTTPFTQWSNETPISSFSVIKDDVAKTLSSQEYDSRYGLHRSDSLWKTGACSYRIQSDQTWTSIISSALMLRRHHQRLYPCGTSSRQRVYISRNDRLARCIICQNTTDRKTCFYPCRQRVLRSRDYREDRVRAFAHVCHCGKTNQSDQETSFISTVPQSNARDPDSRSFLSTQQLETTLPVCYHSTTDTRRSDRTTFSVFYGQIQLPSHCDQYETKASQYLALLQWPCCDRAYYQRTQERLPISKDSNKTFCGKRVIFPHSLVFIQYYQLVQTSMSPRKVSYNDSQFTQSTSLAYSRRTGAFRQSTNTQIAGTFS